MNLKPRILFRVDANENIGRGHFSRSMAVAAMLEQSCEIVFVSLSINTNYIENLNIPYQLKGIQNEEDFFELVHEKDIAWLDGYQFTEAFKKKLRTKVFKLIETNDIPYVPKNIDVLINHTPGLAAGDFGTSKTKLYLGLEYALLRKTFLEQAKMERPKSEGKGVFISFGGADTYNLGFKFVQGLLKLKFEEPIYWVANNTQENIDLAPNVCLLSNLNEHQMIDYMKKSKVLLIPSSVLSFEAMALRKPFFTGYFVENQKYIFKGLEENELAECYGYLETNEDVSEALKLFLLFYQNSKKQKSISDNHTLHLDGNSNDRFKNIILDL
jgi:spore coat polysaccharide biosynthesis predicted glycosyltransferase SpsG